MLAFSLFSMSPAVLPFAPNWQALALSCFGYLITMALGLTGMSWDIDHLLGQPGGTGIMAIFALVLFAVGMFYVMCAIYYYADHLRDLAKPKVEAPPVPPRPFYEGPPPLDEGKFGQGY